MPIGKSIYSLLLFFFSFYVAAQTDSVKVLEELEILALESKTNVLKTAASVNLIKKADISRLNSFAPTRVFNAQVGVRLEERSPGSYRISIRGSSLRSPFGVRNVKMYWNNIPLSDASGVSYFNQFDIQNMGKIEILRGPASSMYGGGYGGVIKLNTEQSNAGQQIESDMIIGSFNSLLNKTSFTSSAKNHNTYLNVNTLQSDGYRDHSKVNRLGFTFMHTQFYKNASLSLFSIISNLKYQTPGGLTLAQMKANPKASRPKAGTFASVVENNAGIMQTFNTNGLALDYTFKKNWQLSTSVFGGGNKLENPFITNYEKRKENSTGGRVELKKTFTKLEFWLGAEFIKTNSTFDVYTNVQGKLGDAQYLDKIKVKNGTIFTQLKWNIWNDLFLEMGVSYNHQAFDIDRKVTNVKLKSYAISDKLKLPFSSRISLNKIINDHLNIFSRIATAYNAPTAQELVSTIQNAPSNKFLSAEIALNREIGVKYGSRNKKLTYEIAYFNQTINNALNRKLTSTGELEYFVNAGKINQKGLEQATQLTWKNESLNPVLNQIKLSLNHSFYDFKYQDYKNVNTDLKNKKLPGVPVNNFNLLFDNTFFNNFMIGLDYNYLSKIPLNELNTEYSDALKLLNLKSNFRKEFGSFELSLSVGIDNALNAKYSAGFDFNAAAARYYNPSAPRNYNFGFNTKYKF